MESQKTSNQKKSTSHPMEAQGRPTSKSFNSGWALMKSMVVFFGLVMVLVIAGALFFAFNSYEAAQSRAYIVTQAGTVIANSVNGDIKSREIEVRNHVTLFFNKMYSFNEHTYKDNVSQGLNLIGTDGKFILQGYNQQNIHEELVKTSGNISVNIDSIWTDMSSHPYRVRAFVRQTFETPVGRVSKFLWSDMSVKDIQVRTPNNVHGLLIDNFNIINDNAVE